MKTNCRGHRGAFVSNIWMTSLPVNASVKRVDYRQVLDEATFKRFAALRDIRKRVAEAESVPAYVVFTDGELAAIAKLEVITPAGLSAVEGVGEKKIEKYGHYFQSNPSDEKG
ncbi:MAG: HRDC domain-containing protein [Lewinellaceae bacterium]|nr:HRDC domain-containing protein [Lewinellaceae bacterium]